MKPVQNCTGFILCTFHEVDPRADVVGIFKKHIYNVTKSILTENIKKMLLGRGYTNKQLMLFFAVNRHIMSKRLKPRVTFLVKIASFLRQNNVKFA